MTTFDGSIQIQSWDKPDVLVEIEKRGPTREAVDALEIKTSQDGNTIELEVKQPRRENFTGIGLQPLGERAADRVGAAARRRPRAQRRRLDSASSA